MRRFWKSAAVTATAALALTGCSGDDGDGALPADASPAEVVAAGLNARFEEGASFSLGLEGDTDALMADVAEDERAVASLFLREGGFVTGAASEAGFALSFGDDAVALRALEDAIYLRVDLEALREIAGPAAADLPPADELKTQLAQLSAFGIPQEVLDLANAAIDGQWVGITGLTDEAVQSMTEDLGLATPQDAADQEEIRAILEDAGWLDGSRFTEQYLGVTGDGPTYDVTLDARAFFADFVEIAGELDATTAGLGTAMADFPDPAELPEEVSGVSITVEDGKATRISLDAAAMALSIGEDPDGMAEGDLLVNLDLADLGDELDVPDGAVTITAEQLGEILGSLGPMLGGF